MNDNLKITDTQNITVKNRNHHGIRKECEFKQIRSKPVSTQKIYTYLSIHFLLIIFRSRNPFFN